MTALLCSDAMAARVSSRKLLAAICACVVLAAVGSSAYQISMRTGMAALGSKAQHQLDLFAAAIDSIVNRYADMPSTIPLNPDVVTLLRNPKDQQLKQAVNNHLEKFNQLIGSIATFVLSNEGITLASSNWNQPDSFVGEDLTFRPYFQIARQGVPARFYAVGTTRGEPGYFVSHPIWHDGQVVGVAVIKIELAGPLEDVRLPLETPTLIADGNGVVILSSVPDWTFTALAPLTPETLQKVNRTRQYNRRPIGEFPVALDSVYRHSQVVEFPADKKPTHSDAFVALSRLLPENGWRLTIFSDLRPVYADAWVVVAFADTGAAFAMLVMLFLLMRRRSLQQRLEAQEMLERANAELERKVTERTSDLTETNQRLRAEIAERERAEATLRAAQEELVQATKLAVLGQLATGITHELTQPLGALRSLSENAVEFMRRGDAATLEKNLGIIGGLADRMGIIISPLKSFARKSPAFPQLVNLEVSISNAQLLLAQRLSQDQIKVRKECECGALTAWCDPVRLEQVLVNLMSNAIDAMADSSERTLTLRTQSSETYGVIIRVFDTGSGLPPESSDQIFQPFFTTKPAGKGLGLGLAISRDIIRDFGGNLSARNRESGGAEFIISLPPQPTAH